MNYTQLIILNYTTFYGGTQTYILNLDNEFSSINYSRWLQFIFNGFFFYEYLVSIIRNRRRRPTEVDINGYKQRYIIKQKNIKVSYKIY